MTPAFVISLHPMQALLLLVLLLALGYWAGRRSAWVERASASAERIRKLEAGEYGERLRLKWEQRKKEQR